MATACTSEKERLEQRRRHTRARPRARKRSLTEYVTDPTLAPAYVSAYVTLAEVDDRPDTVKATVLPLYAKEPVRPAEAEPVASSGIHWQPAVGVSTTGEKTAPTLVSATA